MQLPGELKKYGIIQENKEKEIDHRLLDMISGYRNENIRAIYSLESDIRIFSRVKAYIT